MPDTVELNLQKVLKGLSLDEEEADICDFSLDEQNEALESQGIQPSVDPKYKPVVGETVTYIVACVVLNEYDEVLMMQEAKKSCAGKWYLPAGRIEKGENIVMAAEREVLEETGLKIECTTLLLVESARGIWMRFVLTGRVVGGSLKMPSEADKESLQAKWIANLDELELRASDITHLIERAHWTLYDQYLQCLLFTLTSGHVFLSTESAKTRSTCCVPYVFAVLVAYKEARKTKDSSWHDDQLPALRPHTKLLLRLVVVIKKKATNRVHVLLSERDSWHLPSCEVHPSKSIHSTLRRFMVELFGAEVPPHRPHGLFSVEHNPSTGKDGVCLTLLVAFRAPLEEVPIIGKCVWHETSKELGDKLLHRVASRNSTFPLHVIK